MGGVAQGPELAACAPRLSTAWRCPVDMQHRCTAGLATTWAAPPRASSPMRMCFSLPPLCSRDGGLPVRVGHRPGGLPPGPAICFAGQYRGREASKPAAMPRALHCPSCTWVCAAAQPGSPATWPCPDLICLAPALAGVLVGGVPGAGARVGAVPRSVRDEPVRFQGLLPGERQRGRWCGGRWSGEWTGLLLLLSGGQAQHGSCACLPIFWQLLVLLTTPGPPHHLPRRMTRA